MITLSFFNLVVRKAALARASSLNRAEFHRPVLPDQEDEELLAWSSMSAWELDEQIAMLERHGLKGGVDFVVVDVAGPALLSEPGKPAGPVAPVPWLVFDHTGMKAALT